MKRSVRYYALWSWATLALLLFTLATFGLATYLLVNGRTKEALLIWVLGVGLFLWSRMRLHTLYNGIMRDHQEILDRDKRRG